MDFPSAIEEIGLGSWKAN